MFFVVCWLKSRWSRVFSKFVGNSAFFFKQRPKSLQKQRQPWRWLRFCQLGYGSITKLGESDQSLNYFSSGFVTLLESRVLKPLTCNVSTISSMMGPFCMTFVNIIFKALSCVATSMVFRMPTARIKFAPSRKAGLEDEEIKYSHSWDFIRVWMWHVSFDGDFTSWIYIVDIIYESFDESWSAMVHPCETAKVYFL